MGGVRFNSFWNSPRRICGERYRSFVCDLRCVTAPAPACSTVAGCTSPFESKSCVIPTFFPRIPVTFAISFSVPSLARRSSRRRYWLASFELLMLFAERLDLHIHSRRQIELHQRVHRLR